MKFKKGQTATEYLIILAVVIVIALIVVGVLGGIPSIGGGAKSGAGTAYWESNSKIAITSGSVDTNSDASLTLRNNMPNTVKVEGITLTDSEGTSKTNSSDSYLAPGESKSIGFNLTSLSLPTTAGETYSFNVNISYVDTENDATYTMDGDGNTYEGTISS
ncbi:MAG: hypothetical protein ACQER9_04130 [Nanobdellota archaeon]